MSGILSVMASLKAITGGGLLLDTLSSTPLFSYSLRKLKTSYAGAAIRIRRSSDNSEQDIGFSSGNLDTPAISSFVGANSAYITKWYDQTGNSYDAVQATQGEQPRIVNAGTIETLSSKNVIRFTGSNFLAVTGLPINSATATGVVVVSVDAAVVDQRIISLHESSNADDYNNTNSAFFLGAYDNLMLGYRNGGFLSQKSYASYTTMYSAMSIFDGTNHTAYVSNSGATPVASSGTFANPTGFINIGAAKSGSNYLAGTLSEILFFLVDVGSTDRGTINTSHQSAWGTP